jgi:hypothetical protein
MTEEQALAAGFKRNDGSCPEEAKGKRVEVILRNGKIVGPEPIAQAVPGGWPADGRGACRWSRQGPNRCKDFDILFYRVIG